MAQQFLLNCQWRILNDKIEKSKIENNSNVDIKERTKIISIPLLSQYPTLPTGCESVTAVMALNYFGDNITSEEFAENWLVKSSLYTKNNKIYGSHPNVSYIGNPFTNYGFGCYSPVIIRAVNSNSKICKAENVGNSELDFLCEKYIDNDIPVLIWATMYMKTEKQGRGWYVSDNEKFTWISGEHCLLMVGYDDLYYYFNDPMRNDVVKYKKYIVVKRYNALEKQAVVIIKK